MAKSPRKWSLLLIPACVVAIALGLSPVRDPEVFWHIAMGRFIATTGAVPVANHLLYTVPADTPSFVLPWLSERSLWSLYELLGLELILVLRSVVAFTVVLGSGVLARSRGLGARRAALLSGGAGIALLWPALEPGPGLFALMVFAPLVWIARLVRDRRLPPWTLLAAPLAAALWVNLHIAFLLPALVCLIFAAAAWIDRRRSAGEGDLLGWWLAAAAACTGGVLANPRGAEVFGHLMERIVHADPRWVVDAPLVALLVVAAAAALVVGWIRASRGEGGALDPADVGLGALLILLSVFSLDAVPLFAAAWPLLAGPLWRAEDAATRPGGCAPVVATLLLLVVAVAAQPIHPWHAEVAAVAYPGPARGEYPLKARVTPEIPVEAAQVLKSWGSGGQPIFHDRDFAGYLVLELLEGRPLPVLWVDPREELLPEAQQEVYSMVSAGDAAWRGILQQYEIRVVVVDLQEQAGLVERLEEARDWELVVEGERSALYQRR